MRLSNIEYIFLRLIRKFIVTESFLLQYGKWLPYYRINQNECSPTPIVDLYWRYCLDNGIDPENKTILELGPGSTNSVGYETIERGAGIYFGYEPYAPYIKKMDDTVVKKMSHHDMTAIKKKVSRIETLTVLKNDCVDIVFSNSVLEHVYEINKLINDIKRVIKKKAVMFHIVDYRDHFFKYPFHYYQFSKTVWDRFLNPGDLPRATIADHLGCFNRNGFTVDILDRKKDKKSFDKVKNYLDKDYMHHSHEDLSTTFATLFVKNDIPE